MNIKTAMQNMLKPRVTIDGTIQVSENGFVNVRGRQTIVVETDFDLTATHDAAIHAAKLQLRGIEEITGRRKQGFTIVFRRDCKDPRSNASTVKTFTIDLKRRIDRVHMPAQPRNARNSPYNNATSRAQYAAAGSNPQVR